MTPGAAQYGYTGSCDGWSRWRRANLPQQLVALACTYKLSGPPRPAGVGPARSARACRLPRRSRGCGRQSCSAGQEPQPVIQDGRERKAQDDDGGTNEEPAPS